MTEEITKVIENVDELFPEIVVNGESHVSERYVEPEPTPSQSLPQSSEEQTDTQPQQTTQGEYVDTLNLNGVEHDLKDSPLSAEVAQLQLLLGQIQSRLNELSALIPSQASAQNQLADKNFVNSSIATNTANFLGTYTSLADIEAIQNPTNNDYAFLETADGAGNNVYDRYKYSSEDGAWLFEYELNNSSFTAEQWATINSGITQVSDTVQDGDTNPVSSDAVYEALQNAGGGGAQCGTAGNVQAKVATMDGFVLNTGVTFPITFANSNSYNGKITLNVNSTGVKDVYINNAVSSSSNKTLNAGSYICWYDGTNYYIDTGYAVTNARNASYATSAGSATTADSAGKLTTARKVWVKLGTASTSETKDFSGDTAIPVSGTLPVANGGTGQTSLSNVTVGKATTSDYSRQGAYCTTAGGTQAKVASMRGFVLQNGATFPITFTNSNSYNGKITLNVNGTGAKDVYINGSVSNSSNKTLNAGTYLCKYASEMYFIDTVYAVTTARNANYASTTAIATTANHIPTAKPDNTNGAIWVS